MEYKNQFDALSFVNLFHSWLWIQDCLLNDLSIAGLVGGSNKILLAIFDSIGAHEQYIPFHQLTGNVCFTEAHIKVLKKVLLIYNQLSRPKFCHHVL